MNETERYVRNVLRNIQAPPHERARIEADLRAHLAEALAAGEPVTAAIVARMGSAEEVAAEFMAGVTLHYAGFWRRLVAFAVDVVLCFAITLPLIGLGVALGNAVPPEPRGADYVIGAVLIALTIGTGVAATGFGLLYFPILEGRFGQTVGKRLLRLRVIKETGAPIGYKEAFLRRLSFYFDFALPDALFILFTAKRQRAFDIIARTVVIRETT
jgi:uncharacterized RDD family membrane protein YckC